MEPIEKVYPDAISDTGYWWGPTGYDPLLKSMGHKILLQVDDHDYQGDSRLILKHTNGRYGMLIFGWGSCSGCDALQACNSYADLDELRKSLNDGITWMSKKALHKYISTKDWELEWAWHTEGTKEFIEKAIELLK